MADAIRGGIVINEIHAQPVAGAAGFDTDGNGTASARDEYLEFLNTSGQPIDLSGLQLWDPGSGNWFTFPAGSLVAAGGRALVVTGVQAGGHLPPVSPGSLAFDAARGTAILNNPGDNIYLVDPVAQTFIAAAYGDWPLMDPRNPATWGVATGPTSGLASFPTGLTQIGAGENFGAVVPGDSIQRQPDGGNTFANNVGETPGAPNLCFTGGVRIATPAGLRRIEHLRPGEVLSTFAGRTVTLRWTGARRVAAGALAADPARWPVAIAAGALGPGRPLRPVVLSPHHRVLVAGDLAQVLAGRREILVPAHALCGLPGIRRRKPARDFTYHHLLCDRHAVLVADGLPAESLYLGPVTRHALSPEARAEVMALFPDLDTAPPEPARHMVGAGPVRRLIARGARPVP